MDISDPAELDLLADSRSEYNFGGWWLFAFPRSYITKAGYPLPMFILGDDMEYSIRGLSLGKTLQALPQIGVWHEPFYAKERSWNQYYKARNYNIVHALHFPFRPLKIIWNSLKEFALGLALYDYKRCRLFLMGMNAYLEGPKALAGIVPAELHARLTGFGETPKPVAVLGTKLGRTGILALDKGFKALTLLLGAGHLYPAFNRRPLRLTTAYGHFGFWADYPVIYRRTAGGVWREYRRSYIQFIKLSFSIAWLCTRFFFTGFFIRKAWQKQREYLCSEEFWKTKWL